MATQDTYMYIHDQIERFFVTLSYVPRFWKLPFKRGISLYIFGETSNANIRVASVNSSAWCILSMNKWTYVSSISRGE